MPWTSVTIPLCHQKEEHVPVHPVSRSLVLIRASSQFDRKFTSCLPSKSDFWLVCANTSSGHNSLNLPLSGLCDTDGLQVVLFDEETLLLKVLLDDFDANGACEFQEHKLVIPDENSVTGAHFQQLPSPEPQRIVYKATLHPDFIQTLSGYWYLPTDQEKQDYDQTVILMGGALPALFSGQKSHPYKLKLNHSWENPERSSYIVHHSDDPDQVVFELDLVALDGVDRRDGLPIAHDYGARRLLPESNIICIFIGTDYDARSESIICFGQQ
ncbi:hypothetical protein BDR26DRAFT_865640 [Obelidium mucronatum]|nr:hypothetical protein BDR26DRAFT_865640 [Obelidium mucronatum]